MSKPSVFNEADLIQSICRESFYAFVQEFWDVLIKEEPVWNWHIKYLCDELQAVAERVFKRLPKEYDLIINIPPGTTKSTICSQMFPAWVWTRMPEARIISGSYEHSLALTFSRRSRDVVESEKYQAAFRFKKENGKAKPSSDKTAEPVTMKGDQNAKGFYENVYGGDRKAVGAGGNITGSHGHFIIVDDPLNPKQSVSEAGLKEINSWMDETLPSRKVDKDVTPTILIMQRLHEDDPTGHLLAKSGTKVKHICLPATTEDEIKPARLKLKYVDGMLDPKRLSAATLEEQKQMLGPFGYAAQYRQTPVPRGGGMFLIDKIDVANPMPALIDFVSQVRYWDKAGTKGAGCFTVGAKLGLDKWNRYWIMDIIRGQWDSGTRERLIKQTAEMDGYGVIVATEQEGGSGGKESAENTIFNLAGFSARADKPVGSKETRADPFSVQVNIGNVYVPHGAPWWEALRNELQFFPFSKYKDQVDALAAAFAVLTRGRRRTRGAL